MMQLGVIGASRTPLSQDGLVAALREQMGDQAPVVEAPPPRVMQFGVHLAALALFTLLTVTRALPIVLHPAHAVTPDPIDPVFNSWDLASTAHSILSWQHGLWSFFDGNGYYPTPHPASYIDAAVGMLPFSLPLYLPSLTRPDPRSECAHRPVVHPVGLWCVRVGTQADP